MADKTDSGPVGDVFDRLRSPHGAAYLRDLTELNSRYPAEFVFIEGKRRYLPGVVHPSLAELLEEWFHTWTAAQKAEFEPRYRAWLATVPLVEQPADKIPLSMQTFKFKF